jgi:hypothetical protein
MTLVMTREHHQVERARVLASLTTDRAALRAGLGRTLPLTDRRTPPARGPATPNLPGGPVARDVRGGRR